MKKTLLFIAIFVISLSFTQNIIAQVSHTVNTQGMTFVPQSITIATGDNVTFINTGGFHNVNGSLASFPANPQGFANTGGVVGPGVMLSNFVFGIPGTYNYQCDPHIPGMVGTIIVLPSSSPTITSVISTDPPCNGGFTGSVDITINQSTPPIGLAVKLFWQNPISGFWVASGTSYSTSPSWISNIYFFGLQAGDYRVDLIDTTTGLLIEDDFFTLVNPPPLLIDTLITTPESSNGAFDGSAYVVVSGGVSPYNVNNGGSTYPTNGSFTWPSLAAGVFCLTVTDNNGCSITTCDTIGLSQQTYGCTDSLAINYDSLATIDDSSCVYCDLSIDSLAVTQMTCFTWNNASVNIIATGTQPLPYNYYVVRLNPTDTVFQGSLGFHSGLSPGIYVASVVDSLGCFDSDTFTINSLDSVYIDTVIYSNPSCNGMANGYISAIIPMGGTPPYQFSLNGGLLYPSCLCVVSPSCPTGYVFSGLAPGTHTVEIWDSNMCANSYQIIITNPSASIDTVIINPASCFGAFDGSITLTLSGGAPPYSFNWTGPSGFSQSTQNISSLYAGSYACIISDMTMCQYTTSFQVLSPNPLYYTISNVISETCYGYCDGQITINATGGTWQYYYDSLQANVWPIPAANQVQLINDTLIDSLCSGAHMIYLTDSNGCEGQVLPGGVGITTITSGQQNTSSYDTVSVTLIYVWNGMTLTVSGDYFVTLTNSAGCDSIAYLNLTITNTTGLLDVTNTEKNLLKITDMLGQKTPYRRNTPLFYIYDDGTVEKRIVIE